MLVMVFAASLEPSIQNLFQLCRSIYFDGSNGQRILHQSKICFYGSRAHFGNVLILPNVRMKENVEIAAYVVGQYFTRLMKNECIFVSIENLLPSFCIAKKNPLLRCVLCSKYEKFTNTHFFTNFHHSPYGAALLL